VPGELYNANFGAIRNGRVTLKNVTLSDCIMFGYGLVSDSILMHNASILVRNASILVRNASTLVRDASTLMHNASTLVRNASTLVRDAATLLRNASTLVRDASTFNAGARNDERDSLREARGISGDASVAPSYARHAFCVAHDIQTDAHDALAGRARYFERGSRHFEGSRPLRKSDARLLLLRASVLE
jgi:hypothetical protein